MNQVKKTIRLFGPPPKSRKGSFTDPRGYWVTITKEVTGFNNPSKLIIKAVYNYCTNSKELEVNNGSNYVAMNNVVAHVDI